MYFFDYDIQTMRSEITGRLNDSNKRLCEGSIDEVLKLIVPNWTQWCATGLSEAEILLVNSIQDQSLVHTKEFLGILLYQLHIERTTDDTAIQYLEQLLKKFEVFGRLFTVYGPSQRKASGAFNDLDVYILCAVSLLEAYRLLKKPEYLNTALKINDMLMATIDHADDTELVGIAHALKLGQQQVEAFYADQEFRMPSH